MVYNLEVLCDVTEVMMLGKDISHGWSSANPNAVRVKSFEMKMKMDTTTIVQYHASLRSSTPTQPMFSRALTNRSEHVSAAAYSVWYCAMVLLYQMPAPSDSGYWMPSSSILSRCYPPLSWYNICMRGQEISFASSLTMIFIFVYLRGLIARFWQSLFSRKYSECTYFSLATFWYPTFLVYFLSVLQYLKATHPFTIKAPFLNRYYSFPLESTSVDDFVELASIFVFHSSKPQPCHICQP